MPFGAPANNQVIYEVKNRAIIGGTLSLLLCACGGEEAAIIPDPPPPSQGGGGGDGGGGGGGGAGAATLNWSVPTHNTDDTPLTNLMGFRVYYGTNAASLSPLRTISNPAATSTVIVDLASGTHYFAVTAVTTSGTESALSPVGSKSIQ